MISSADEQEDACRALGCMVPSLDGQSSRRGMKNYVSDAVSSPRSQARFTSHMNVVSFDFFVVSFADEQEDACRALGCTVRSLDGQSSRRGMKNYASEAVSSPRSRAGLTF